MRKGSVSVMKSISPHLKNKRDFSQECRTACFLLISHFSFYFVFLNMYVTPFLQSLGNKLVQDPAYHYFSSYTFSNQPTLNM